MSEIAIVTTLFYVASIMFLFIVLPRQMMYMASYTVFYLYHAIFLAIPISLHHLAKNVDWSISGRFNLFPLLLIAMICTTYCYHQAKYTLKNSLFPSVFDQSQDFWAYKSQAKIFMALAGYEKLKEVRSITKDKDILIVPVELSGNSSFESNAIFEFYTQRHAIPYHNQINWCHILRSRVKETHSIILLDKKLNVTSEMSC